MHLFSFVATFYCLYATSAPPVLASAPRGSLESNRQMSLKENLDSPRRTLVEVGSGIGGFSWTSMNTLKDCFRKAAGSIQTRCAELDMNEEERVVAAISMTLCELATAKHHAPPMECDVFSARLHEPSYQSGFSEQQNEEFENSRGKCVNALSRSAQFWSSYSGYLREIHNAKEIFRNISLNQDVFLQMVVDREHVNKAHAERWSAYFDDAADIANEISLLTQRIQAEASGAIEELQKHGIDTLGIVSRSLSEFRSQVENDHSDQVKEINSALAGLSERHSHDLQAIVPELEIIMHELITQSFETARKEQGSVLNELTTSVQDQWRVLYSEFSAMHELSDVLDRLAERTNEHMEVFDVKAEELKEKLLPPPTKEDQAWFSYESVTSERWWKGKLVSVLGFLIRGASLSSWTNSPFLQMLEIIWIVTFWLLRQSLSTITASFYSFISGF
ncbi:hypothetical protein GGU10DRAFT_436481 [Lentinula aff. detonsa]|uniref:Karyogamy protein 5 n=1 Tax=Lentinula aff. detonsa TaxID=2804958 RepID=A0AA38KMT9_9AGAR|nr:hypothetical protein GGU10DRAFT_436481 [Lentinula aff. detonsa]